MPLKAPYNDFELRLGCVLAWARFREQFHFTQYAQLADFVDAMDQYPHFSATTPN